MKEIRIPIHKQIVQLGLLLPRRLPAGRGPCCTRASKEDAKRVERSWTGCRPRRRPPPRPRHHPGRPSWVPAWSGTAGPVWPIGGLKFTVACSKLQNLATNFGFSVQILRYSRELEMRCRTICMGLCRLSYLSCASPMCLLAHSRHAFVAASEGEDSWQDEGVAGAGP